MGQDFRLLAPVRGLTRPPIPHPFHGLWQNCPETFLHEDIDFFSFYAEGLLLQLDIVMSTSEVLASVFLEVGPHKISGPFRTDQPVILNLSIQ